MHLPDNFEDVVCPYCGDHLILENKPVGHCSSCERFHHEECWAQNQGCAIWGCIDGVLSNVHVPMTRQQRTVLAWQVLHTALNSDEDEAITVAWREQHELLSAYEPVQAFTPRIQLALLRVAALSALSAAIEAAGDTEVDDNHIVQEWQRCAQILKGYQPVQAFSGRIDLAQQRVNVIQQLTKAAADKNLAALVAVWEQHAVWLERYQTVLPWSERLNNAKTRLQTFRDLSAAARPSASARETVQDRALPLQADTEQSFADRDMLLHQVNQDAEAGNWERAITMINIAIKQTPADTKLHASLAELYFRSGHMIGAVDQWRRVLALQPHYQDAPLHLANCYCQLGRFGDAAVVLEQAVGDVFYRSNPNLYRSLALIYDRLGSREEALWALDKAQELNFDAKLAALRAIWQTQVMAS